MHITCNQLVQEGKRSSPAYHAVLVGFWLEVVLILLYIPRWLGSDIVSGSSIAFSLANQEDY